MTGTRGAAGTPLHAPQPHSADAARTGDVQPVTTTTAGVGPMLLPAASSAFTRRVIASVTALNVAFLAGTLVFLIFFRRFGSEWKTAPDLKFLLIQFHLGAENVLATWYSSMLLLLVALAFVWCFAADGAPQPAPRASRVLRFGWLALAAGFVGLSLDEIGSLHERIGTANPLRDYPLNWLDALALPLIAAAAFMGLFAFVHVARRRTASMLLIGLGTALLLFVIGFEHIEERLWPVASSYTAKAKPMWYPLVEEGTELFAMTAFLAAALIYVSGRSGGGARPAEAAPEALAPVRVRTVPLTLAVLSCLAILAAVYVGVGVLLKYAPVGDNGIPQNWFPAALAALASLACVLAGFRNDLRVHRRLYLACAGFLLILSVYYGANMRYWVSESAGYRYRSLLEGALLTLGIVFAFMLAGIANSRWSRLLLPIASLMLAVALARGGGYPGARDPLALGLLLLALTPHVAQHRNSLASLA